MSRIFAVCMNKGGVGKTTLVTHLAGAIARRHPERKVLIVDTDAQGNAAVVFGQDPEPANGSLFEVFTGRRSLQDVIIPLTDNLHLAPASEGMDRLEFEVLSRLDTYSSPFHLLKPAIETVRSRYDYMFIDCPPSLGLAAGNALKSATDVLLPFVPEAFSVRGLQRTIQTIETLAPENEPAPRIAGVVAMMVDARSSLHQELLASAREFCRLKQIPMFDTVIPRSLRFANAAAYEGKPAVWSERRAPAVAAYYALAEEVMNHAAKKKRTAR